MMLQEADAIGRTNQVIARPVGKRTLRYDRPSGKKAVAPTMVAMSCVMMSTVVRMECADHQFFHPQLRCTGDPREFVCAVIRRALPKNEIAYSRR
jgi:hypothetical protein